MAGSPWIAVDGDRIETESVARHSGSWPRLNALVKALITQSPDPV
jgi:hypothetical protein